MRKEDKDILFSLYLLANDIDNFSKKLNYLNDGLQISIESKDIDMYSSFIDIYKSLYLDSFNLSISLKLLDISTKLKLINLLDIYIDNRDNKKAEKQLQNIDDFLLIYKNIKLFIPPFSISKGDKFEQKAKKYEIEVFKTLKFNLNDAKVKKSLKNEIQEFEDTHIRE